MKAIINNKIYDTTKAEAIIDYRRKVNEGEILNSGVYYCPYHNFTLYKTAKGSYFEHDKTKDIISVLSEEIARDIVRKLEPDLYIKLFGDVEEA